MSASVIIPAGGVGKRFGADLPKQFVEIAGAPLMVHTLNIFNQIEEIESIVVAVHTEWYSYTKDMVKQYGQKKVKEVIIGGMERQDSVSNAIHTKTVSESDIVMIHDAVRPFCTPQLIKSVLGAVEDAGAVIPATKPTETIKEINHKGEVIKTIDRSKLAMVQTPQAYWYDIIKTAYEKAMLANFYGPDSASLVEFIGYKVTTIEGESSNLKITNPYDLKLGELILSQNK
ncbi:MAG TPA: 2-C-methyl-D-erythritol 4-phosphate cytidylyltransferase [Candidatus Kapabacteria bacterium]|nr:2-C-methyl-D-erythritol 4-phosphate cytidylyltransferase [Candidatus Kapabacteria bacterium]